MKKLEQMFLLILIPFSFFTVVINTPSFVAGYLAIALVVLGLYLYSLFKSNYGLKHIFFTKVLNVPRYLLFMLAMFLVFLIISTVFSIDIAKTFRGLFMLVSLVVLVYTLYVRTIIASNKLLNLKVMLGTVVFYQVLNMIFIFTHLPKPSFLQTGMWPYLYPANGIFHLNYSAMMIAFAIPALIKLTYITKNRIEKGIYFLIGLLFTAGLLLSFARASFLMVFTYMAVMILLSYKKSYKYFLGLVVGAVLSYITMLKLFPMHIKNLLGLESGLSARDLIWAKGLEYIQQKPWFGYGYRTMPGIEVPGVGTGEVNFHSLYMAMAVELGVLATIVFLAIVFVYLFNITKRALQLRNRENRFVAFSCSAFIISVMVYHIFEQVLFFFGNDYYTNVYLIIYLVILQQVVKKEEDLSL